MKNVVWNPRRDVERRGNLFHVDVTTSDQRVLCGFCVDPKLGSSNTNTVTLEEPHETPKQLAHFVGFLIEYAYNSSEIEDMRTRRHLAEYINWTRWASAVDQTLLKTSKTPHSN